MPVIGHQDVAEQTKGCAILRLAHYAKKGSVVLSALEQRQSSRRSVHHMKHESGCSVTRSSGQRVTPDQEKVRTRLRSTQRIRQHHSLESFSPHQLFGAWSPHCTAFAATHDW